MIILTPTLSQNSYFCGHKFTVLVEGSIIVLICSQISISSVEVEKTDSHRVLYQKFPIDLMLGKTLGLNSNIKTGNFFIQYISQKCLPKTC